MGHRFNLAFLAIIGVGAALLTVQARRQDQGDPAYLAARAQAEVDAHRVVELAQAAGGIPAAGAVTLLREDPLTQGPRLFSRNCSSCHRYGGHDGLGNPVAEAASAPDLKGFGSRAWLEGMLDPARVDSPAYYGGTRFAEGKMVRFVKQKVAAYSPEQRAGLLKVIAAVSAEAALPAQANLDQQSSADIEQGRTLARTEFSCTDCHAFRKPDEDATAPDLTGWGSREWVIGIISDPTHDRFYGKRNDRMPTFLTSGQLDAHAIAMLADWLRGDWFGATNGLSTAGSR